MGTQVQGDYYGLNGVLLDPDKLDEFQLYKETRNRDFEHALCSVLWLIACGAMMIWASNDNHFIEGLPILALLMIFGWLSVFVFFGAKAKDEQRLPKSITSDRQHKHVTGLGALVSIALIIFIGIAISTGEIFHPEFRIPEWAGYITLFLVAGLLTALILAPHLGGAPSFSAISNALRKVFAFLEPVGLVISTIDSWLVLVVAPTVGASCENGAKRYTLISANLLGALAFTWFAPAPYGLIGIIWSLLAAVSIVRRWAWIEHDREGGRGEDLSNVFAWRAGSKQDLRDEALAALLLLVIALPFGLRQVHLSVPDAEAFFVPTAAVNDPTAWFGFFGIELLKAIPFIDWSDIYEATGDTRILISASSSMHAVFAARVIIDMIFLATVVQAVTISITYARQRTRFLSGDRDVKVLDERIEKSELSKLAKWNGHKWEFNEEKIEKFKHYDTTQLSVLRLNAPDESRLRASIEEIFKRQNYDWEPPQDLLIELSTWTRPDVKKLHSTLDQIEIQKDIDLAKLTAAREALSGTGGIEDVRQRVAKIMVNCIPPSEAKVQALTELVSGSSRDSLASVRAIALEPLKTLARRFLQAQLALEAVALRGTAQSLRARAKKMLHKLGHKIPASGEKKTAA